MGIIYPQTVCVKVHNRTIKYYEKLGYSIPKKLSKNAKSESNFVYNLGAEFEVDVFHLPPHAMYKINCICDECNKSLNWTYSEYTTYNHDGKCYCVSCANKVFCSGENSVMWNPNLTLEDRKNRRLEKGLGSLTQKIYKRDNYTCQCCNKQINKNGIAHHIDSWDWCIEKRYDSTNLITLCNICHKNFHSIYGYGKNTKEQFKEWLDKTINLLDCKDIVLETKKKIYCIEDDIVYNDVSEISHLYNLNEGSIYASCKSYYKLYNKHYLYYDDYLRKTDEEINEILKKSITRHTDSRIILLNNLSIFNSVTEASHKTNISPSVIVQNAAQITKTTKGNIDGYPMIFMYYSDYLNSTKEDIDKIFNKPMMEHGIICLEDGNCYIKRNFLCSKYNITKYSLEQSLKNNGKKGTTKNNTHWITYIYFISLPQQEQLNIIEQNLQTLEEESFLMQKYKELTSALQSA